MIQYANHTYARDYELTSHASYESLWGDSDPFNARGWKVGEKKTCRSNEGVAAVSLRYPRTIKYSKEVYYKFVPILILIS